MPRDKNEATAKRREQARQLCLRGKFREALRFLRLASPRPRTITADQLCLWNEFGMVCKYAGRLSAAERYYRLALRHSARHYEGPALDFFRANLYHNLGGLEHSRHRFRRGEAYTRKALHLRCRAAGPDSLGAASDMAALGALLDGQQRFAESETLYRKALRVYRREYGKSHAEIAVVLNNLAAVFQATAREQVSRRYYQAALRMKRKELGRSHPDVALSLNNLAMLEKRTGKWQAARFNLACALTILRRSLGKNHPHTRAVRKNLADLERTGR